MSRARKIALGVAVVVAVLAALAYWTFGGGELEGPGTVHPTALPADVVTATPISRYPA